MMGQANGGIRKSVITYLPVVASDGTCYGRHGHLVVDALHVLVVDLRDWSLAAICRDARKTTVDLPSAVGRAVARVDLRWRRLAAGLLSLAQGRRYANGGAGLVDALVPLQRQLCCAG